MSHPNETTVSTDSRGYYKTAVPYGLAESMDLDGARVQWKVKSGNTLEVTRIDD